MGDVKNVPATAAEQREVTYTAADGSEIRLTPDMVRKYLVQGHGEMVTIQEMVYFLNVCRSRKLNPFIKDCFLIKYSQNDPAAVVTSVDYFRKRARAQKDCKGWKSGIIVKDSEGKVKDTAGLFQDGETLLGGWFEARPDGWTDPLRLEVNLRGYIKKTKEGNPTRFWSTENQPSQIQKVAESQGLRRLWPDEFQGLYTEEEITQGDRGGAINIGADEKPDLTAAVAEFDKATGDRPMMTQYIDVAVKHFKKSADEIKAEAVKNLAGFLAAYDKWAEKNKEKKTAVKDTAFIADEMAPGACPDNEGVIYTKKHCDENCNK
ncbi:MAG: phage recombination protein Bet, partial [Fibrobacterota bacterium]